MIRGRWIWDESKGQLVDADSYVRTPPKRSSLSAPMVIMDTMPETQHMANGKIYTSKSEFRKITRATGHIEVGNDKSRFDKPKRQKPDRKKIVESIEKAKAKVERGEYTLKTRQKYA